MGLIILCILFSITCVSAEDNQTEIISQEPDYHSFAELNESISNSTGELDLKHDYKYDDVKITIQKSDAFVINGNNHIIDGITGFDSLVFNSSDVVTVNNLTFQNCRDAKISMYSPVIFNNVKFINCSSESLDIFIFSDKSKLHFENCVFQNDSATSDFIYCYHGELTFTNNLCNGGNFYRGIIYVDRGNLLVENCTFENISSKMSPAINYKGCNLTIKRSKFFNLNSRLSAGAVMAKFFPKENVTFFPFLFEDCEFINLTSTNDGGAIYSDMDSGAEWVVQNLNVVNSNFTNCKSEYGGAICNLGGVLNIINSTISNSSADFEGGAVYTSWSNVNIINSTISGAVAEKRAGAIYFDRGKLTIRQSNITGNKVLKNPANASGAIYDYEADLDFSDSTFDNGGISIYAVFTSVSRMDVEKNNDTFSLDNEEYITSVENSGIHLDLINNTIIIDSLPSRFDSRDWGWVTPDKYQNDNEDCWAFATVASLEAALLKSTGVAYNLSQNYAQKLQLKYAIYGNQQCVHFLCSSKCNDNYCSNRLY